jgi:hypothetical protein
MQQIFPKRLLVSLAAFFLAVSVWAIAPVAQAYDNPDLLPNTQTPVIDLANFLPALQEEALIKDLETFEAETGWKLRVLTQYDRTPGRAVKNFWGLNDKSVLLIADARGVISLVSTLAMTFISSYLAPSGLSCRHASATSTLYARMVKTNRLLNL